MNSAVTVTQINPNSTKEMWSICLPTAWYLLILTLPLTLTSLRDEFDLELATDLESLSSGEDLRFSSGDSFCLEVGVMTLGSKDGNCLGSAGGRGCFSPFEAVFTKQTHEIERGEGGRL